MLWSMIAWLMRPITSEAKASTRCCSAVLPIEVVVMDPPLLAPDDDRDVVWVDQVGDGPAVEVVLGQALLGKALVLGELPAHLRGEKQLGAHVLVVAGVVALVQLVPGAELAGD